MDGSMRRRIESFRDSVEEDLSPALGRVERETIAQQKPARQKAKAC